MPSNKPSFKTLLANQQYDDIKREALALIEHGQYADETFHILAKAVEATQAPQIVHTVLEQWCKAMPNSYAALFYLAKWYFKYQFLEKAYEAFLTASKYPQAPAVNLTYAGLAKEKLNQIDAAEDCYQQAVLAEPENLAALCQYGAFTYVNRSDPEKALRLLEKAKTLNPNYFDALNNSALVYQGLGDVSHAEELFSAALDIDPSNQAALTNRAFCRLSQGKYELGFSDYDGRWHIPNASPDRAKDSPIPKWQGETIEDGTLIIWTEQGVGDEIMFLRLMPLIENKATNIHIECGKRLVPLIQRSYPKTQVFARDENILDNAQATSSFQVSAGDLGKLCIHSEQDFPKTPRNLCTNPDLVATLKARYAKPNLLVVGLAWHSVKHASGHNKSIHLVDCLPFLKIQGCRFVNLQYGDHTDAINELRATHGIEILTDPDIDQMQNIDDFAAQVDAMDLVISISNTTAHIAGSLGKPTLLMLSHAPDWRWRNTIDYTPWYPSVKIFRQAQFGDWTNVVNSVAQDLAMVANDAE